MIAGLYGFYRPQNVLKYGPVFIFISLYIINTTLTINALIPTVLRFVEHVVPTGKILVHSTRVMATSYYRNIFPYPSVAAAIPKCLNQIVQPQMYFQIFLKKTPHPYIHNEFLMLKLICAPLCVHCLLS